MSGRFRYRPVGPRRLRAVCQGCGEFCSTASWSEEQLAPGKAGKGSAWSTVRRVNLCLECAAVARECDADGRRLLRLGDLP